VSGGREEVQPLPAVITRRLDVTRIISVRRAREEEVALYEATDPESKG
jgi:uncharacterized DUF497 family protein